MAEILAIYYWLHAVLPPREPLPPAKPGELYKMPTTPFRPLTEPRLVKTITIKPPAEEEKRP